MAKDNRARITDLQEVISQSESRVDKIKTQIQVYETTLGTIQANHTTAQNVRNGIQAIKGEIDWLLKEIISMKDLANQSKNEIEDLVSSAEESKATFEEKMKNLEVIEAKISEFETKIIEQLWRVASGTLAQAFHSRQESVEIELVRWRENLYKSTISLIIMGVIFFIYSFWAKFDYQFMLKISVSFPVIYAAWFSGRQYDRERRILEQYAFKSAQSKSLSAFSKTVKEIDDSDRDWTNQGGKERTQKFVISSIEKIYTAPNLSLEKQDFPLDKILDTAKQLVNLK